MRWPQRIDGAPEAFIWQSPAKRPTSGAGDGLQINTLDYGNNRRQALDPANSFAFANVRLRDELERQKAAKKQERMAAISKSRRQKAKRSRRTKRKMLEGERLRRGTKKLRGRVDG